MTDVIYAILALAVLLAAVSLLLPIAERSRLPFPVVLVLFGMGLGVIGQWTMANGVVGIGGDLFWGLRRIGLGRPACLAGAWTFGAGAWFLAHLDVVNFPQTAAWLPWIAFAADRAYMLALPDDAARAPKLSLSEQNFGAYPMANDQSRLVRRFYGEAEPLRAAKEAIGQPLDADGALALGLVTAAPDDIDWADETRIAIEERVAMSPDALTGLEANLRFAGQENMATRIFGRLTAWQNWIFIRPNAVGEKGALKVYGKGEKAQFDWNRV